MGKVRSRTQQPNALSFDVRGLMYQLAGVDLTQIHGIGSYLAVRLVAECGTDLSRWPTAKHFTSWLTLLPGCKVSGGKGFVHWCNVEHRHSGIRYVTPAQRHAGDDRAILEARRALYAKARGCNPACW